MTKINILTRKTFKKSYAHRKHTLFGRWKEGGGRLPEKKNSECWYIFHILPPPWNIQSATGYGPCLVLGGSCINSGYSLLLPTQHTVNIAFGIIPLSLSLHIGLFLTAYIYKFCIVMYKRAYIYIIPHKCLLKSTPSPFLLAPVTILN